MKILSYQDHKVVLLQPSCVSVFTIKKRGAVLDHRWSIVNGKLPLQLSAYISIHSTVVFSVLVDLAEEECHAEKIPKLSGRNRSQYIERLRTKYFPESDLSLSVSAKGKYNRSVLLCGITSNTLCDELLLLFKISQVSVQSIHSATTLMPIFCKQAGHGSYLNILPLGDTSYRLIASHNGAVVLSRRIDVRDSIDALSELKSCVRETQEYLHRLSIDGWLNPSLVIYSAGCADDEVSNTESIVTSRYALEDINNVDSTLLNADISLPLASMTAVSNRGYAQKIHRQHYFKRKVKNAGLALALSSCFGAISTAALAAKVEQQYEALSDRYEQSALIVDNALVENTSDSYPVEAVRQALVTARLADARSQHSPLVFLKDLAAIVDPAVSIDSVNWEREDLLDRQSLQAILAESDAAAEQSIDPLYRATVSGVINERAGSALDIFEAFVSLLRLKNTNSDVVVVEAPFSLANSTRTSTSDLAGDGAFVLQISNLADQR